MAKAAELKKGLITKLQEPVDKEGSDSSFTSPARSKISAIEKRVEFEINNNI